MSIAEPFNSSAVDYHLNKTHTSRSMLATFAESRRLYEMTYVTGEVEQDENDNLTIGTGTHAICLKDAMAIDKFTLIPASVLTSNGQRRGKAWDAFKAENTGRTLLLESQLAFCQLLASRLTERIGKCVDSPRSMLEREFYWDQNGCDCRAKLDMVVPAPDGIWIFDLKTAADISEWGFWKAVRDRRLWLQYAHYSIPVEREYGAGVRFVFLAVEKSAPYRVRAYELSDEDQAMARRRHAELLADLMKCRETGDYSESGEDDIYEIKSLGEMK